MKKAKYKIIERTGGSHGGLYELEQETYFDVVEVKTGKVLMTFEGASSATFAGGQWANWSYGGVSKVEISPDERSIIVYSYGHEKPEVVRLPS